MRWVAARRGYRKRSVAGFWFPIKSELALDFLSRLLIEHSENLSENLSTAFRPALYLTLSIASLFVFFSKHPPTLDYNVSHHYE